MLFYFNSVNLFLHKASSEMIKNEFNFCIGIGIAFAIHIKLPIVNNYFIYLFVFSDHL